MSRRGWVLFAAMALLWGMPYLFIAVAVEELTPATLVFGRTSIGAALLVPIAMRRRAIRPVLERWKPLLAFCVVEVCVPWLMLAYAQQHVSSSLAGMLIAAVPLVGAVLVTVLGDDRLDSRRIVGLAIGFAGVVCLVGFDIGTDSPWAVAAIATVVVGYAVGPVILSRHLAGLPGIGVMAATLAVAAVVYAPVAAMQWPTTGVGGDVVAAVAALGVLCTGTAFVVFYELIGEVGPARATVITYVNPAVALFLGVVVLDETLSTATIIGFALILAGCVPATARDRPARSDSHGVESTIDVHDLAGGLGEPVRQESHGRTGDTG